jgi:hypothetical protein
MPWPSSIADYCLSLSTYTSIIKATNKLRATNKFKVTNTNNSRVTINFNFKANNIGTNRKVTKIAFELIFLTAQKSPYSASLKICSPN